MTVVNHDEWDESRADALLVNRKANETPWHNLADFNDGVTTVFGLDAHQHPPGYREYDPPA
jgi:hypothetical protein